MVDVEKGTIIVAKTTNASNMNDIQPKCIELANYLATGKEVLDIDFNLSADKKSATVLHLKDKTEIWRY